MGTNKNALDLNSLKQAVETASVALMMADREHRITYVNEATRRILRQHEGELRKHFPGFSVDRIIGSCIDIFHKRPEHQRAMLADPKRLPHHARIEVGPLTFDLIVTANFDEDGGYTGNTVEWKDVTDAVKAEAEREKTLNDLANLKQAADGASTALMMCDPDFTITYCNDATMAIMRKNEAELRKEFPHFSADRVVGSNMDQFHKNPEHQRRLLKDPTKLPYTARMNVGSVIFEITASMVRNHEGQITGYILEWKDMTDEVAMEFEKAKTMAELANLKQAADGASAGIMMADPEFNITYANETTMAIMRRHESDLRSAFPFFAVDKLVGSNMDIFHKDVTHQRRLLADPRNLPHRARVTVGSAHLEIYVKKARSENGEEAGFLLEWTDITDQYAAESSLTSLIEDAVRGSLTERFDVSGREGFVKQVGDQINQLLEAVANPIAEVRKVTQALADGNLTKKMESSYEGDFGALAESLNSSISNLQDLVGQITHSSSEIARAAGEISAGNSNLSSRTQEQAAAIEETAATVEELTSTVKQNAENARHADQLASSAREVAAAGGKVVTQAVEAMSEINRSSKRIADIIGVIDEIAFQTNLLALNAAVEAARAGDQGRGFAVVATEVRNLAQRSANAAREIKTLIKDSLDKVEDGTKLVDRSGMTLDEIVGGVKKVSDIVAEIAAASDEQATGIDQVNQAISQMDDATQQNAALVEQAAAASVAMDDQTKSLQALVQNFEVEETAHESAAAATPAPARAAPAPARPAAREPAPARPRARATPPPVPSNGVKHNEDEWQEF